jgi:hypothetical protein
MGGLPVNIPKTGYVGVGEVIGERCRANDCHFETEDGAYTLFDIASPNEAVEKRFLEKFSTA